MASEKTTEIRERWTAIKAALLDNRDCARKTGLDPAELEETIKAIDKLVGAAPRERPKTAVLYVDGAARGNPGPAGAGIRLETEDGALLTERAVFLGEATNNVAEYRALLEGLEVAREVGVGRLRIRTDSQLLARQLDGRYRVKNAALIELWSKARALLDAFEQWEVEEVPRSQNRDADRLANLAIDRAQAEGRR